MIRRILPWMVVTGISAAMTFGTIAPALADRDDDGHWRNNHWQSSRRHHDGNHDSDYARSHRRDRRHNDGYYATYNYHRDNGNHYGQYRNHDNNGKHSGRNRHHDND